MAEFAINTVPSASTGKAPFHVVYGEESAVRLPVDSMLQTRAPAAEEAAQNVSALVAEVRERMQRAQLSQKVHYDKRRRKISYLVGDRVLLSTENLTLAGAKKLRPKYVGPFTVLE